jgi:ATPase subunit of ABC transporter with duplicated ATPase domains
MSITPPHRLAAHALTHTFADGITLFTGLSIGIGDERVGLVGRNGAGKSVLLQILAGTIAPTAGAIHRDPAYAYLGQSSARRTGTVADLLGIGAVHRAVARVLDGHGRPADLDLIADRWDLAERADDALRAVGLGGVALTRDATTLSGGEAMRVAIAGCLLTEPRLLLLDEPTNDLDAAGRAAVRTLIARWRWGLVIATHDREALAQVDRIIDLRGGVLHVYGGAWSHYAAARAAEAQAAEEAAASAEAVARRVERTLRAQAERKSRSDARGRRSRDTGSQPPLVLNAARERSQATGGRLRDTATRLREEARSRVVAASAALDSVRSLHLDVPPSQLAAGSLVVALEGISISPADEPLQRGLDLVVRGPTRIAVTGPSGAGKSTMLSVIAGRIPVVAGRVRRGLPLDRIALLDQRTALLGAGRSLADVLHARHPRLTDGRIRDALARAGFRGTDADRSVDALSGGERMRAALAAVLAADPTPQCLLLDEPTNHLDLETIAVLEAALRAWDGALVVVSHDAHFLDAIGLDRRMLLELGSS